MRREALSPLQATLDIRGRGINTAAEREDVAATTRNINSPEYLEQAFFIPNHPNTRLAIDFSDGSAARLVKPTGGYAEINAMVIARGPDSFTTPDNQPIKTETVYDYPENVQQAYWQMILGTMLSFRDDLRKQGNEHARIIAGENCIATYSNKTVRTSRTVGLAHAHIFVDEPRHFTVDLVRMGFNLPEERALIRATQDELVAKISEEIPTASPRDTAPVGYTFIIPGTLEELTTKPTAFARTMQRHHQAYSQAAPECFGQFFPQPSYRSYFEEGDDNKSVHVTIAPALSQAGLREAANIRLNRHPAVKQRVPEEEVHAMQWNAAQTIQERTLFNAHLPASGTRR